MDIYIKPKKRASVISQTHVSLKDIADVFAPPDIQKKAQNVKLMPTKGKDGLHIISVIDAVKAISAALPGHSINNVGENDTIVKVLAKPPKKRVVLTWVKVALVSLVLFVGASTAIMTFHTDSQMGTIFNRYYEMFFGEETDSPYIISVPYSIGLAIGIVVFFNHFTGKKLAKDPTPIEVEMVAYEKEVEDALIDGIDNFGHGSISVDKDDD